MADELTLTGEFCTIGELMQEDIPPMVGVPAIQMRRPDGRAITLTGLTREECRATGPLFMSTITITVKGVQHG